MTEAKASIYDKAMDASYLKTHVGGGDHRMFDSGHDPASAWQRVKEASQDDSFLQEVVEYMNSMLKDASTVKGLPFVTWDKLSFENFNHWVQEALPFLPNNFVYDLMSYDVMELFSTLLAFSVVVLDLKEEEQDLVIQSIGSIGGLALFSANPLLLIPFVVACVGVLKKRKKNDQNLLLTKDIGSVFKGFIKTGSMVLLVSVIGFWASLILFLILYALIKYKGQIPGLLETAVINTQKLLSTSIVK